MSRQLGGAPTIKMTSSQESTLPSDVDVLVVGGGAMGCAVSYYLATFGVDVCLIDRAELNMQASGANAGSLHAQFTSPYFRSQPRNTIERVAPTLVALAVNGIRMWEQLSRELGQDIEFGVSGGLMVAESPDEMTLLADKIAIERRAG
ncbi:MAG: FAD-dependent oxidoreductase, partial [Betaproteobacteria bacterium]